MAKAYFKCILADASTPFFVLCHSWNSSSATSLSDLSHSKSFRKLFAWISIKMRQ